jgi:hypothetical protein
VGGGGAGLSSSSPRRAVDGSGHAPKGAAVPILQEKSSACRGRGEGGLESTCFVGQRETGSIKVCSLIRQRPVEEL